MVKETLIDWKGYACGANGQIYSYYWKRYLNGCVNKYGYVQVGLNCIDGKHRLFRWHRVIWTFFNGTIPEGLQVNHINENKTDNRLCNLNLMTSKENNNWGTHTERMAEKHRGVPLSEEHKAKIGKANSKPVVAYNDDGEIVHEFSSSKEAEKYGFDSGHIITCCLGKRTTHKGLHWRYA